MSEEPSTPYAALGGEPALRALVDRFYDRMDGEPAFAGIRGLHPDDLAQSRHKLFAFLSGWLGGPPLYVEQYGHPRLRARHLPFSIGAPERDQWLACMAGALDDVGVCGPLRELLDQRFAHTADFMRNADVDPLQMRSAPEVTE